MGLKSWWKLNCTRGGRRIKREVIDGLRTAEEDAIKGHYNGAITTTDYCIKKLKDVGIGGGKLHDRAQQRGDYYREQRQKSREK